MSLHIRPYTKADYPRAVDICVEAFRPIHAGFKAALGDTIFALQYANWERQYAETFDKLSVDDDITRVYVAEKEGDLVGFVFTILDAERKTGEIGLNAVDPSHQGQGIGKAMYDFALAALKARGAQIAYVGAGGDAAHAPARKAYEAVGFDKVVPAAHYFRVL
jgi:GNAT superfamily N-acetyltransferase